MIVSHEHRLIFLKTRKTAGTSVEIALSRVCGPDDIVTRLATADEELRIAAGGVPAQNHLSPPLPRAAWSHLTARGARQIVGHRVWDDYFTFAVERNPWDAVVSLYYWHHRGQELPPFEEFLATPRIASLAAKNARAYRIGGSVAVDRVCRYERLDDELATIWRERGLPGSPDLPQAKAGSRAVRAYRDLYTPATAELVAVTFAEMIAELGYEF